MSIPEVPTRQQIGFIFYMEGVSAAEGGLLARDNPYVRPDERATHWLVGWTEAHTLRE